jgi:hypothetical protein
MIPYANPDHAHSHFLMIFGAHMNILFIIKVKILVLINFEELKEMN